MQKFTRFALIGLGPAADVQASPTSNTCQSVAILMNRRHSQRAYQPYSNIVPPPPPPLPKVHFLEYLKNVLSYRLSANLNDAICQNKKIFFNHLCPPLVTIATSKVDACFWTTHFDSFHAKARQNSTFFAISLKIVLNGEEISAWYSAWWRPGDNFRFTLFFVLQRPYIGQKYHHGTKNGVIRFGFLQASEELNFVDFQQGEQGLIPY